VLTTGVECESTESVVDKSHNKAVTSNYKQ